METRVHVHQQNLQKCIHKVGVAESTVAEVGMAQIDALQVRIREICICQVTPGQTVPFEINADKDGTAKTHTLQHGHAEHCFKVRKDLPPPQYFFTSNI